MKPAGATDVGEPGDDKRKDKIKKQLIKQNPSHINVPSDLAKFKK